MNANKIVGGGTAGGVLAAMVVYLLGRFSVNLTAEDGAMIAAVLVAVSAFVVHNGVVGGLRLVWRGSGKTPDPPVPPAV